MKNLTKVMFSHALHNINGIFTVTSSFWLRPSSFLCHSFILRRNHLLQDQLCGEHTGLPSNAGQCLPLSAFRATHLLLSHTLIWYIEVWWLGIFQQSACSLMCTNHIDMTEHTPAFFTKYGTTHIYVEHSWA